MSHLSYYRVPKRVQVVVLQFVFVFVFVLSSILSAQSLPQTFSQSPPQITRNESGEFVFEFEAIQGRAYLTQFSTDLQSWGFLPRATTGQNHVERIEIGSQEDRLFFRLAAVEFDGDAETADFDNDGLSNLTEISMKPFL